MLSVWENDDWLHKKKPTQITTKRAKCTELFKHQSKLIHYRQSVTYMHHTKTHTHTTKFVASNSITQWNGRMSELNGCTIFTTIISRNFFFSFVFFSQQSFEMFPELFFYYFPISIFFLTDKIFPCENGITVD